MLAFAVLLAFQQTVADSAKARQDSLLADSARTARSSHVHRLETVQVSAVRTTTAPLSERTLARAELQRGYTGQETPILLARAPGLTAYAESGSASNYSYMRLRGIDQTRINITLDGIPLNEPEDEGLFFSNFPDFASNIETAQVQRGVGTSTYGVASYAGSVSFESVPVASVRRGGELQLTRGAFNTSRLSAAYRSGLTGSGFAGYIRASAQKTDGYRYNSGNSSNGWFASGGWFGARDVVKATLLAGLSSNEQAYYASPLSALRRDRRDNPYGNAGTDAVDDRFHQDLAALSWTHAVSPSASIATTAYGFDAGGWYDVPWGGPVYRYDLHSRWGGIVSALDWKGDASSLALGIHVGRYAREHWQYLKPDLATRLYDNTGYKGEQSAFAKGSLTRGRTTLFADLQLRGAQFRYEPTAGAGVAPQRVSWRFFNPKAGVTARLTDALSAYASAGMNGREPTRADMFAGADDVDSVTAQSVFPLTRVHPESVRDLESGVVLRRPTLRAQLNLFAMSFRDEIAPIGGINAIGYTLRKNVARSRRQGVEGDVAWRATPRLTVLANASLTDARIRSYTDDATGETFRDVTALLTPKLVTNHALRSELASWLSLDVDGRYTSRMMMTNTNDARFTVPASYLLDAGATVRIRKQSLLVRVENVLDRPAFASGYTDGTEPSYYVVAPLNLNLSLRLAF
ncbi:MAG TPA: TonB-dependent receptor [Gemmatimonadaceae bacterium]|nr:TonB-dependent receptor [Gemmatimonadaceae bacterium]